MPDVVEFKPVRARRPHRSVRPKLLNIKGLDRRTAARKAFDALVAEIEHDLGGREQLSAIEKSLIQAYAGSAILLDDLNARVVLGQEIDVGTHAQMTSALVRIASRLGLQRRQRDVTPTVEEYLRSKRQELPSRISLRQALADPALLGGVLEGESWKPWRTLLLAAMGEELTEDERPVFKKFTGREREPGRRVEEFVGVKGRRAGGSYAGGKIVIPYLAGLCQHPSLVRGERGVLLCVAADQRQADVILDYADASFRASPVLSQLIEGRTQRELRLNNGIDIEVRAADYRRLRGLTFIAVIADEVAFWSSDFSANPDDEILNAVRPGLATTGGPLFMISSPYARRGELWRVFQRHYGAAGDPLIMVAKGSSREFNATLLQSVVDRAYERDPAAASAEYGAEFRRDIESFVAIEAVTACVSRGVYERAPQRGVVYSAFVDPSGGSADAMTLAIGHRDHARQVVVIDALREVAPPFSPEKTVEQFASLLRTYNCFKVVGDRFAGDWPVEVFGKFGVQYEQSAAPKSDLYRDLLASLNSQRVDLLDHPKIISELCALERRTSRGGRDSIDHPPGGHDDVANVIAGVAAALTSDPGADYLEFCNRFNGSTEADRDGVEAWRRLRDFAYVSTGGAVRLW